MAYRRRSTRRRPRTTRRKKRTTRGSGSRWSKRTTTGRRPVSRTHSQHVRGFLSPFSATRPRLLDGAVSESQTHTHRATTSINIAQNKNGVFLIQPDIFVPVCWMTDTTTTGVAYSSAATTDIYWDTSGVPGSSLSGHLSKSGNIDRWRMVSQAVRLSLINTTDADDGWFEAYRITSSPEMLDFELRELNATPNFGAMIPRNTFFNDVMNNTEANGDRVSYSCGPLKDLNGFEFKLTPLTKDHNFKFIYNNYELQGAESYVIGPPRSWRIGVDDVLPFQKVFEAQRDTGWDSVIIIIHAGSTLIGSTLLVDHVQNCEVVYEHTSSLARFQQPTVTDVQLHEAVRAMHLRANKKAAVRTMKID